MEELTQALLFILEHPNSEKGYRDLKKGYKSSGFDKEADAINHLLTTKFVKNADSNLHSD